MTIATKIELHLSGGAANTDVSQSIGGVISSTIVTGQYVTGNDLPGITITKAYGNPLGTNNLTFISTANDGKQRTEFSIIDNTYNGLFSINVDGVNYTEVTSTPNTATDHLNRLAALINADSGCPASAGTVQTSGSRKYIVLTGKLANDPFTYGKGVYNPNWSNVGAAIDTFALPQFTTTHLANPDFGTNAALKWFGGYADFGISGSYRVKGTGGETLYFDVVFASIPSSDTVDPITVNLDANETKSNILADDSYYGATHYFCYYVKNNDTVSHDITLYIGSQPTGNSDIEIGVDTAGIGNGSTTGVANTTASITDPPVGVVFSAPSTEETGIDLGTLAAGECIAVWQKRHIAAGIYPTVNPSLAALSFVVY